MSVMMPFNFQQWIADNRDKLKPPVANKNMYPLGEDFIVMVVGGPNARKDYHYNETEELFYQLEGDICVTIQQDGKAVKVPIKEGEMFLLPAKTPHSPGRSDNSIGLVIERVRKGTNYKDGLMWFCDKCNTKLYEEYFQLEDVEKDFLPVFKRFFNSEENRTCNNCNHVMQTDPRFTDGE
ncbi:MAG: 3-hydroxyanthranilate 3,4-dioxygenase [Flavobacteriales bacterium]|nr:MAG: 3-hydroxyanthranilate 3,4-dioxygenase [Flavobacteriales bacterium]